MNRSLLKHSEGGLHVLCDKPAGVTSSQARRMDEAAKSCGCIYGMIFNQRALAINQKIHEIIESGVSLLMETLYSQYSEAKYT